MLRQKDDFSVKIILRSTRDLYVKICHPSILSKIVEIKTRFICNVKNETCLIS